MNDLGPSSPRIDSDLGAVDEKVFRETSSLQASISYGSLDHNIEDDTSIMTDEAQTGIQNELNEDHGASHESTPFLVDQDTGLRPNESIDDDPDSWDDIFVSKDEGSNKNFQAIHSIGDETCATDSFDTHIASSLDSRCDMSDFMQTIDEDKSWDSFEHLELLREKLLEKTFDFDLPVDPDKGYKATKLSLWSFQRPHMRAFHGSWMCFCCAWLIWFSIVPLLPIISEASIPLTKEQIWTSNTFALLGTFSVPILAGPL